jgi:hypothetical protein
MILWLMMIYLIYSVFSFLSGFFWLNEPDPKTRPHTPKMCKTRVYPPKPLYPKMGLKTDPLKKGLKTPIPKIPTFPKPLYPKTDLKQAYPLNTHPPKPRKRPIPCTPPKTGLPPKQAYS